MSHVPNRRVTRTEESRASCEEKADSESPEQVGGGDESLIYDEARDARPDRSAKDVSRGEQRATDGLLVWLDQMCNEDVSDAADPVNI